MTDLNFLEEYIIRISGMSREAFALSEPHWQLKHYKKGEFYNEYKNVCKYLGFVLEGVFRIYRYHEPMTAEKNMLFFTRGQLMTSYRSFMNQTACEYFTESMTESTVLYIHHEKLHELYKQSHEWERFGRLFAESSLDGILVNTESFLFQSPEERYAGFVAQYPEIFQHVPLYHIASYLGIEGPSLSRIRKRLLQKANRDPANE